MAEEVKKRPSILFVVHSLVVGGTENLVFQMAKLLKGQYRVGICCLDKKGTIWDLAEAEGIELFLIERPSGFNLATISELRKVFEIFSPSIIHAHQYTPLFYSSLAKLYSPLGMKLLFTEHGRHYPDIVSRKRRIFNKLLRFFIDKIIVVSEFTKTSLVEQEGFAGGEIEVIYNGIDCGSDIDSQNIRDEIGVSHDTKILAVVGSLRPVKNPLFPLRAYSLIAKEFPSTKLLFLGEGELRPQLEEFIEENGLSEQVELIGSIYPAQPYFGSFNLFIMGSLSEACSLALLEAMQVGVPVIVSNRGGSPELVQNGEFGGIVDCDDDFALADEMRKVLLEDSDVAKKARMGMDHVRKNFSFELMFRRYSEVYSSMLDS